MSRRWWPGDHWWVQVFAWVVGYCGVISQTDKAITDPHLQAAAIGTAFGAVLALKKRPGQ